MQGKPSALLAWALLVVIIGWRLQDFFELGMTTNDQLVYSTDLLQRGVWEVALDYARQQGRLYVLLTNPLDLLPATYATNAGVQIANLTLFAAVPFIVGWMIFHDRADRIVFLLSYWSLCAVGWFSTAPAAYPILPTVPLVFAGLAAASALGYAQRPSRSRLVAFGLLVFAACFQYEPGALLAVVLLIWLVRTRVSPPTQRRNLYAVLALSSGLYAIAYLSWRLVHPTAYEGATLGELSPIAIGRVIAAYALGALPLTNLLGGMPPITSGDAMIGRQVLPYPAMSVRSLLFAVEWMDVVIATAGAALLWALFAARRTASVEIRVRAGTLWKHVGLGLLILLLANVLLALTTKYQVWARGWRPYLTSYYALFGWAVLMTSVSRLVVRRWHAATVVAMFAAVFVYSAAYNHQTARQIRASFSKWEIVAALAACSDHVGHYRGYVVPAAFHGVSESAPNWSRYWRDWTRRAFGSALEILPAAGGAAGGLVAFVRPERDGRGHLDAVVGNGESGGFLIYRGEAPHYLSVRPASPAEANGSTQLIAVERLEHQHCRERYRLIAFGAAASIDAIEVIRHLPSGYVGSREDPSWFPVAEHDTERSLQALYLAFANRPADPGGLQFWADRVHRAGGTLRDVAEAFSRAQENEKDALAAHFPQRLAQSYRRLVRRAPTDEEAERLSSWRERSDLVALLPWLVAADLLKAQDATFSNTLELARYYTQKVYPVLGWRADLWDQSVRAISDDPGSVQQAIAILSR
jgi:hypothetical protein